MTDSARRGSRWCWGGRGVGAVGKAPKVGGGCYRRGGSDVAEVVLEQLDEQWFCDNVVRWVGSSRAGEMEKGVIESSVSRLSCAQSHDGRTPGLSLTDGDQAAVSDTAECLQSCTSELPAEAPTGSEQADGFVPSTRPPSGPLMGVTEDEEMENGLFAKMLANRPAKLTTINPGRSSLGPLQENQMLRLATPGSLPSKKKPQPRPRRRLKGTKSLTDLEYEELRGFEDLGFEVSTEDLTPHVVRMFPGLQRQGIPPYNSPHQSHNAMAQKGIPHGIWPRRPASPLLMNAPLLDPSIDMKGQLKSWASEMASIVSIEC